MLKRYLNSFLDLLYPPLCVVCNKALINQEEHLCINCIVKMPVLLPIEQEKVSQLFWGIVEVEQATSTIHYTRGSPYTNIIKELKYNKNQKIAQFIGLTMAKALQEQEYLKTIDVLVPVPLHKTKLKERGFNQAELIAKALSLYTGIPVCSKALIKNKVSDSQTNKKRYQRWLNSSTEYSLNPSIDLSQKHLLLIDDVLTTGATLTACIKELYKTDTVRISVASFALSDG